MRGLFNFFWGTSGTKNPASPTSLRARRSLRYEPLEDRVVPAVNLFLDFGDGSTNNSFTERLTDLSTAQGISPFTPAEILTIQTAIRSSLSTTYNPFGVSFVETNPGTSIDTVSLGQKPGVGNTAVAGTRIQATTDWRNFGYITEHVFPSEFLNIAPVGSSRNQVITGLSNALAYYTTSAAGAAIGLKSAEAYGDPSIAPATYANIPKIPNNLATSNAHTVQNSHFGLDRALGLTDNQFVDGTKFTLSPLQKVSLEYANRLIAPTTEILSETNSSHQSIATAQTLNLQVLPISNSSSALLSLGNISVAGSIAEKDYYQFAATAGEIVTISLHSSNAYQFGIDSTIRLLGTDGTTVLAASDDTYLGSSSFAQVSTTKVDIDSLLLNIPIGSTGNYYLEVTSKTTYGLYDAIIAKWSPQTKPWQNPLNPLNVDNSSGAKLITPLDALIVINYLNSHTGGNGHLPNPPIGAENPVVDSAQGAYAYIDTNGDNSATPLDALIVINDLNSPAASGESPNGEALSTWSAGETTANISVEASTENSRTITQDLSAQETLFALYGTLGNDLWLQPTTGKRR